MSVLYKALQKAAKDNEQRQAPTAPFDAERLAGSGVIRASGGHRVSWRIAGAIVSVVFIAAMGAAFYLTSSEPAPPPKMQIATAPASPSRPPAAQVTPPPPAQNAAQAPTAPPAAVPAPAAAPAPAPAAAPAAPQQTQAVAAAAPESAAPAAEATEPDTATAAPESRGAAATRVKATPQARAAAARQEPMPDIDPDSPARMLNPPINIHRNQIDLEGVGNAVTVRRVSQAAQDTVGSGYNALIRGEYDTALGFYDQALKQEPSSVLALLGRGAALQKLGRKEEARQSYDRALKANPGNREALTNLTALEGERAPGDALARLIDLEREYPNFSPVKAQIGLIYARLENFDGALEYFRRALVVTPDAPLYMYNMALVLDRLGRGEQAVTFYERVLNAMSGGRSIPELSAADIQRRVTFLRAQ
jgi:tetratricopeptide (TPR) repeat protein